MPVAPSPSYTGAINLDPASPPTTEAAQRALHLKVFSGEVMNVFREVNVMEPLVMTRTITSGKSAQFPKVGRVTARYHKPGNNILEDANADSVQELNSIRHNEEVILIDSVLQASVFIDALDEALNHYDVRRMYASELGHALAVKFDHNAIAAAIEAARQTTPTITGDAAGETIQDADFVTNAASAVDTIFTIAQKFDEKYVPKGDRYILVTPEVFYKLVRQTDLISRDFNPPNNGSMAEGMVRSAASISIVMSNHIPQSDLQSYGTTTDLGQSAHEENTYHSASNADVVAVAFHKSCVGVLKLMDMTTESDYLIQYQGDLMVAKMAIGMKYLRPESAILVDTA